MKNLEQQFSEDLLITPSSNSVREYSDHIPSDLLIDIFSRVPTKSVGRFRCVSKSWRYMLRLPDFTELFLTKSLTRPRILFAIEYYNELFLFSSAQPQNNQDGEDYSLVATRYNDFSKHFPTRISLPFGGLVILHGWGRIRSARVICNPVTGESIILPHVKAKRSYFGYDPISKQFKVLSYERTNTHRVLTLGTGKPVWRSTMECKPHSSHDTGICINGVLYYGARFEGSPTIVCFDFSSEKFSFIKMHKEMLRVTKLMNYKGKLCAHDELTDQLVVLWVLEDAGEHKWSKRVCELPLFCGARTSRRSVTLLE